MVRTKNTISSRSDLWQWPYKYKLFKSILLVSSLNKRRHLHTQHLDSARRQPNDGCISTGVAVLIRSVHE